MSVWFLAAVVRLSLSIPVLGRRSLGVLLGYYALLRTRKIMVRKQVR